MIDLSSFANDLKEGVKSGIPYPKNVELDEKKHKNTPKHIRDIALGNTEKYNNEFFFDLGNEQLERDYPYYHILEDSEVIHKRKKGTSTSKGSQATIIDKSKRDYGKILVHTTKSGKKSYYQEYRKNVRGKRSAIRTETIKVVNSETGEVTEHERKVPKSSTTYINVHYHYIEKTLENKVVNELCTKYGLKPKRKKISGLEDDKAYFEDWLKSVGL